ncbi:integral membrane protein [Paramyrothecium foliicola]|nr:integral membrane protein [Paramyrothecium foliicola]
MPIVNGIVTVLPVPSPDYVVDFDNPQRQAVPHAYWIAGAGTILSLLMMGQRLYTKFFLMGKMQADDIFLVLAWLISMVTVGLCVHMFASGAGGVHGWEIDIPTYNIFLMDVYLAAAIYIVGGSSAKVSLLIFYLRLSPQRWFRMTVWATLVFISGYTIGIFFALIFACNPIAMSYDVTVQDGTCINRPSLYIATAVVNIISDAFLFCLPLPIVVKLQVPRRQKIGLILIFLLGSITIVTSIIRVSILPQMLTNLDQTWIISWASVWIIVEANLFIVCAALPTLRKFFKHIAPNLIGESRYGRSSKATNDVAGTGPQMGLRTIGTKTTSGLSKRNHYSQFDDADDGSNLGPSECIIMSDFTSSPKTVEETTSQWNGEERVWEDDGSEKAIVKDNVRILRTDTVTVEYHKNP